MSSASFSWAMPAIRRACSSEFDSLQLTPESSARGTTRAARSPLRPPAARARRSAPRRHEPRMSLDEIGTARCRRAPRASGRASRGAPPRALPRITRPRCHTESHMPENPSGLRHVRNFANWSAPTRKTRRHRTRRPCRSSTGLSSSSTRRREREPRELEPSSASTSTSCAAGLTTRGRRSGSSSKCASPSRRAATWPLCGGLNVPPSRPVKSCDLERLVADLHLVARAGTGGAERLLELLLVRRRPRRRGSRGRCGRSETCVRAAAAAGRRGSRRALVLGDRRRSRLGTARTERA